MKTMLSGAAVCALALLAAAADADDSGMLANPAETAWIPAVAPKERGGKEKAKELLSRTTWSAWGDFDLAVAADARADAVLGLGFSMGVIAQTDLMPGKDFPFPIVVPLGIDLKYWSGEDEYFSPTLGWRDTDVHSVIPTFKADFGIDLLWKDRKMMLFPFAGIGMGFESTKGDHITYDGGRFVFTMQAGACFAFFLTSSMYVSGRILFCANLGAVNVRSYVSFDAGMGLRIG